jgi:hypothetical protein
MPSRSRRPLPTCGLARPPLARPQASLAEMRPPVSAGPRHWATRALPRQRRPSDRLAPALCVGSWTVVARWRRPIRRPPREQPRALDRARLAAARAAHPAATAAPRKGAVRASQ